ncbi:MAG: hypothetical protein OHK0046_02910 [Anaerolineae bacterium]
MSNDIFLSYCREDTVIMHRVRDDLRKAELKVWTDEGIPPGNYSWKKSIQDAILDSTCLVAILSPDALQSRWVMAEMDYAELHGKPIYIILARGDEREVIPFGYAAFQWVDIRDDMLYGNQMGRLIGTVKERLVNPSPPRPLILAQPFEWCEVTPGSVTIHYDKDHTHSYDVERFYMARYPITNAQYQAFLDDPEGYSNKHWWEYSTHAAQWRKKNSTPRPPTFKESDLPRENVTWFEAMAFCRWLSARTGYTITLPTEQQWQRAAQGDDGRTYPWDKHYTSRFGFADGNSTAAVDLLEEVDPALVQLIELGPVAMQAQMVTNAERRDAIRQLMEDLKAKVDTSRANTYENGHSGTTPVTKYPKGSSPYQVMDMSGNVWEWCRTTASPDEAADPAGNARRVLRGGSWATYQYAARVTYRLAGRPTDRESDIGFRVVCLI